MTVYIDASVLVPIFVEEQSSAIVSRWIADLDGGAIVSTLAAGEFASAISRLVRNQDISSDYGRSRLDRFDEWLAVYAQSLQIDAVEIARAIAIVRRFDLKLRMPDAIHVAACAHHGLTLATFDVRLARSADSLGVITQIPS